MKTNDFIKDFPKLKDQEVISMEIMEGLEGGKCTNSCAQGCKKGKIKNDNKSRGTQT